jgi:DNA replication and repair protein RecF
MILKTISLSQFRNFSNNKIEFSEGVTVIVGDNATGKTNILEAICLLSTGKSFKARLESEMIAYGNQITRITGRIYTDGKVVLEAVLTDGEVQVGDNPANIKKTQHKKLLVNGVAKRLVDFAGNLKVVLFGPWDLDLVTESPSLRRKFLDSVLSQTDREYRRSVMIYEKGLRQRNRLLLRIRDEGVTRGQLMYWDRLLIKHGQFLTKKREEFIAYVNLTPDFLDRDYSLTYDSSAISEGRLAQYEEEEVAAATTLVGPHRDDFLFMLKRREAKKVKEDRDLARYGSRGEARMGVLWLKLAELSYIKSVTNEVPVLLLDDIFSELDHEHREVVMEVCRDQQTIITTADVHNIKGIKGAEIIRI